MAKILQLHRGTTAQNDAYAGAVGEVTVDTTKKTLRLHDGATAGGKEIVGKSDLATVAISGKYSDLAEKPALATVATSGSYSDLSNTPNCIPKTGDAGAISKYETALVSASAITITDGSNKNIFVSGGVSITVSNGTAGKSWEAKVHIASSTTTVTLGSSWKWIGDGEVADNSILVLSWCNTIGYACIQAAEE